MMALRRLCAGAAVVAGLLPLLAATRPVTLQWVAADAGTHPYCAVLDADVFAETAPGLRGLHLMQDGAEIPFLTTVSEPASEQTDAARILHLREENGALVFDLGMPARAYTAINFKVRMQDFVATAEISAAGRVEEFKLFDLSREHLARQTMVQLPEMRESVLHVVLRTPGMVLHADDLEGVDVLPDRAGQSLYSVVAEATAFANTERETIAELDVAAHVPVQRIRFETAAANFLRRVRVEAWPASDPNDVETISGVISSTHRSQNGDGLADAQLVVPMTLGANLQGPARVRVIVENNDGRPLVLKRVALEMREHKLCFDAKSGTQLALDERSDESLANPAPALTQESWEHAGMAVLGAASYGEANVGFVPEYVDGPSHRTAIYSLLGVFVLMLCVAYFILRRIMRRKNRTQ